jgi:hypothetical protein
MSDAETIVARARSLGLTLSIEGDCIAISPTRRCPPDLLTEISEHKSEVMALLAGALHAGLCRGEMAWLPVAQQILAGEFDGCCGPMRENLVIGLRSIRHPACERALAMLEDGRDKEDGE